VCVCVCALLVYVCAIDDVEGCDEVIPSYIYEAMCVTTSIHTL
jgi:hypothetical protein